MTYEDVLKAINSRTRFGIKPGLDRIKKLLNLVGNPQDKLKFIHVAGTNGKGSVCKMLSLILSEASYRTGLFTSPYVIDFRERFQINNEMISKDEIVEVFLEVQPFFSSLEKNGDYITEFELITAMAFLWFYKKKCDIVVLEVGLGGQFDATNVISSSILSIITSISLDHVNILGDTIEKIAAEKAGILKNNGLLVLYQQPEASAEKTIRTIADEKNCTVVSAKLDDFKILEETIHGTKFTYRGDEFYLNLCGRHQLRNVAVVFKAVECLNEFNISKENIKTALKKIKFPARIDLVSTKPLLIIDGAHNPDGVFQLRKVVEQFLSGKKIIGVTAMLKDKDVKTSLSLMTSLISELIVTEIKNVRSLSCSEIYNISLQHYKKVYMEKNATLALKKAHSLCDENSVILVFGSLYLAGEIYNLIGNRNAQ